MPAKRLQCTILVVIMMMALLGCSTSRSARTDRRGFFDRFAESSSHSSVSHGPVSERAPSSSREAAPIRLNWPLKEVRVTSPYGRRRDGFHEGIDLRAKSGTPIYAAQAGTVIYADRRIRGYGRMVVIRHGGDFATIYAHNSKVLVKRGQRIAVGQKIAISGSSGRTTGPHLHFEIRRGLSAVDPMSVMPSVLASVR